MIDILDPTEAYSAARFVQEAQSLMADIHARGRWPVLVGGTMLYFKALIDGIDALPAANPQVRAELDAEAARLGWPAMHAQLAQVDPATAARLAPMDAQRIQRALEVWRVSGQPLSAFHTRGQAERPPTGAHLLISLEPTERAWLHQRIQQRFEQMWQANFVGEVLALRARGDLHLNLPAMRCVGYRQVWEALDAGLTGQTLQAQVMDTGCAATRQLAKRQLTWLRSLERHPLAAEAPDVATRLLDTVGRFAKACPTPPALP
ncbi:MAG: tRNA (adenosine(37)-N6)-dimethylallyltransferase MiaA [Ideonella sp. MAG2]|nr:MAG: tRNA (adenosine(37)-N6)-dimethylallyltransferase MiaA [Ideonella sp. MAG2]